MADSAGHAHDSTLRFHQTIADGSLDELRAALNSGAAVNAPGRGGMTALMVAIDAKDLGKAKLLLQHGADPELADDFNATALRRAVHADFVDGVRFLLSLGVERGYEPRYPLKQNVYAISLPDIAMPVELKGLLSDAEWKESLEENQRIIREMGENPTVEPMISEVQSVDVLKIFLEAGDDLSLAPTEIRRALMGLETGGELRVARRDYRKHRSPRNGSRNPERMDFAFWKDMIRTGVNAYAARMHFKDTDSLEQPVWCYDRFGSSLTQLSDGRFVQIGGEHEDYYDSDFFIYNDVVIHDGRGDFQIFGYPRNVFPPTDFHTATHVLDGIYVVGCLGYPEQRQVGFTPVYRLTLDSWRIEAVDTTGEMPGWIHKHRARYDAERHVIRIAAGEIYLLADDGERRLVPNEHQFELDLTRFQWRLMS